MAVYIYKAMTKSGMIVRNRVESPTKQNLVKILKNNGMLPISIDKMPYGQKKQKVKKKKNVADMNEFIKGCFDERLRAQVGHYCIQRVEQQPQHVRRAVRITLGKQLAADAEEILRERKALDIEPYRVEHLDRRCLAQPPLPLTLVKGQLAVTHQLRGGN